jgi:class 3 adenylate cyclase
VQKVLNCFVIRTVSTRLEGQEISEFEELHFSELGMTKELRHVTSGIAGQAYREQFALYTYQPRTIRSVSLIGVVWFFYEFLNTCFTCSKGEDGAGGSGLWILGTWLVEPIVGAGLLGVAIVFSLKQLQIFCQRNYNIICVIVLVAIYLAVILPRAMLEIRLSIFQQLTVTQKYDHIHWEIDASNFPPIRKCNDTNPLLSWTNHTDQSTVGCNSIALSGSVFSFLLLVTLLPTILHMSWGSSLIASISNSFLYLVALILTGTRGSAMISAVVFQLVSGLFASYFCAVRRRIAWAEFLVERSIERASERNGNLLYTLIPRNVMARLASHHGSDMLGRAIPHCTIMFCALEQEEDLQAAFTVDVFELLCSLFADFDDAVKRSGMFKYQHVGGWYIVACPRAERPFDEEEYAAEYPQHYTLSMLHLAHELRLIAIRRSFRGAPLRLQVGLHCGAAAGAVIGAHRAFYCLYGDTVNTAARMCKCAGSGGVRGSKAMAEAVGRLPVDSGARFEPRGSQEIKGKGMLETFELLFTEPTPDSASGPSEPRIVTQGSARFRAPSLSPQAHLGPVKDSADSELSVQPISMPSTSWLRGAFRGSGEIMRTGVQTNQLDRFWAIFTVSSPAL